MILSHETAPKAVFFLKAPFHMQEIVWMDALLSFRLL
jgi:hypothetical protein